MASGKEGSVTVDDVAAQAGVSIKTVSRVLNNEPNTSEKTRAKVMAAIELLKYQPNPSAPAGQQALRPHHAGVRQSQRQLP